MRHSSLLLGWFLLADELDGVPFHTLPLWHSLQNYHLNNLQQEFMDSKIKRLLKTSAIHCASPSEPLFTSPIGVVPKKNRKMWMIINMHLLNTFINTPQFKYNSLGELMMMLHPCDWTFMMDFCNSFHHTEVLPQHQPFLRFRRAAATASMSSCSA
jgi:hypothetical protein